MCLYIALPRATVLSSYLHVEIFALKWQKIAVKGSKCYNDIIDMTK